MSATTRARRRREGIPVWSVWLLLACLYLLSLGRGFYSSDGEVMFQTTAALVERGTLALEPDPGLPQIVAGQGGAFYSKYDPGLPLIGVPFFVLGDTLGQINRANRYQLAAISTLLIPALAAAGVGSALYALARRLFGARRGVGIALAAGLATIVWPYARVLFAEAVLAAALTLAVLLIVRAAERNGVGAWLSAGAMFGLGLLVRAAFGLYALPLAGLIVMLSPGGWRCRTRRLIAFGLGAAPFVIGLLAHNALRFGDPLRFGYAGEHFDTPPWEGAIGLLLSPGKSIFLYAPPLVLSVLLWPRFRRAYPALGLSLALGWIAALAFYGAWWAWHGGWSWGPRFVVPLVPLSCLPLGMLPASRRWHALAAGLIALGVVVQIPGVLVDAVPYYAGLDGPDYAAFRLAPRDSPLIWAARQVIAGQTEPLALFHLRGSGLPPAWWIGTPALAVIGAAVGAWRIMRGAILTARKAPPS